jgi:hypothetical protein
MIDRDQVPIRDAAKIRCRSRRTSRPAADQSAWSQPGSPPSGPFTMAIATASNVPIGFSAALVATFTDSPLADQTLTVFTDALNRSPLNPALMRLASRRDESVSPPGAE